MGRWIAVFLVVFLVGCGKQEQPKPAQAVPRYQGLPLAEIDKQLAAWEAIRSKELERIKKYSEPIDTKVYFNKELQDTHEAGRAELRALSERSLANAETAIANLRRMRESAVKAESE